MGADRENRYILTAEDRTKMAFDSLVNSFRSVEKGLGGIKTLVEATFASLGGIGLTAFFKETVSAASLAEQASNRLNAVMRATGDTSGYTREQLDKMANSLSKATTFDEEGMRNAQANLMKFGRLHGETFERALKLSADYAAFTGGTMVDATQAIGRALADPVNGVKVLGTELGKLTQTQKDSIQNFIDQGRIAEAQAVLFKKLESSIGGTAGMMNSGLFGATSAATKAWDDLLKAFGKTAPVQVIVTGGLDLITKGLDLITESIEKQNKAFEKNPLYNGGKLQPLPDLAAGDPLKALQGGKLTLKDVQNLPFGLRPSIVPGDKNAMTVDEVLAGGRADAARRAEETQARLEARKKLMKETVPLADELSKSYAEADIRQKTAAQELLAQFDSDQIKQQREFEQLSEELGKADSEAKQKQQEAAAEIYFNWRTEENARLGILDEQQKRDRLVQVLDGMRTEREIVDQDWVEKQQLLMERFNEDYTNRAYWQKKLLQLDKEHSKAVTEARIADLMRMNDGLALFSNNIQSTLGSGLYDAMQGNFKNIGTAFSQMLEKMLADALAANLVKAMLGSLSAGQQGGLLGLALKILTPSAGAANPVTPATIGGFGANGASFDGMQSHFAMGGVVNSPTRFSYGGGFWNGMMGEAGPEAIMPLRRDSSGRLGVEGGKGTQISYAPVIQIDSRTDRAEVAALVNKSIQRGNADLVDKLQRAGAI